MGTSSRGPSRPTIQPDSFTSDNSPDTEDETFKFEDYAAQPRRSDRQGQPLVLRQRRVLAPGDDARRRHRHFRPEDSPLPREADAPGEREEPDLRDGRVRPRRERAARDRRADAIPRRPRSRTARRLVLRELGVDPQLLELPQREGRRATTGTTTTSPTTGRTPRATRTSTATPASAS